MNLTTDPTDKLPKENVTMSNLRRHDFVVSVIVWIISFAVFIESWRLTFHLNLPAVDKENIWLVAPGIFPLVLSISLLLMFSIIIWISFKEGEFKGHYSKDSALSYFCNRANLIQIAQISLLCLYVFGLLGRINFGVASALYLFASMFIARAAKWYFILLISIIFSAAVTYLFGSVMKIPLP